MHPQIQEAATYGIALSAPPPSLPTLLFFFAHYSIFALFFIVLIVPVSFLPLSLNPALQWL